MKNIQMKIRDLEKWDDDYYPKKEKDLDTPKKGITNNRNKNKL